MAHVFPFLSLCTSIPGVAGCALTVGQYVYRDPVTQAYHPWLPSMEDTPDGMAMEAAQPGQVAQIMVEGVFYGLNATVAPPDNPSITLPGAAPGSICEQCFDAPALVLRAALWGGDMGVCLACLVSRGEEA